jgi:hypothetical protein
VESVRTPVEGCPVKKCEGTRFTCVVFEVEEDAVLSPKAFALPNHYSRHNLIEEENSYFNNA